MSNNANTPTVLYIDTFDGYLPAGEDHGIYEEGRASAIASGSYEWCVDKLARIIAGDADYGLGECRAHADFTT